MPSISFPNLFKYFLILVPDFCCYLLCISKKNSAGEWAASCRKVLTTESQKWGQKLQASHCLADCTVSCTFGEDSLPWSDAQCIWKVCLCRNSSSLASFSRKKQIAVFPNDWLWLGSEDCREMHRQRKKNVCKLKRNIWVAHSWNYLYFISWWDLNFKKKIKQIQIPSLHP